MKREMVAITSDIDCDGVGYGYQHFIAPWSLAYLYTRARDKVLRVHQENERRFERIRELIRQGRFNELDAISGLIDTTFINRLTSQRHDALIQWARNNGYPFGYVEVVLTIEEFMEKIWPTMDDFSQEYFLKEGFYSEFYPR